jgi:hypothetical protein
MIEIVLSGELIDTKDEIIYTSKGGKPYKKMTLKAQSLDLTALVPPFFKPEKGIFKGFLLEDGNAVWISEKLGVGKEINFAFGVVKPDTKTKEGSYCKKILLLDLYPEKEGEHYFFKGTLIGKGVIKVKEYEKLF